MSPTSLGQLPTNSPVPTGLVQVKRGGPSAGGTNWTGATGRAWLLDGAGGYMTIGITPSQPGWWLVRAESIWAIFDAVWSSMTWAVDLTPADVYGVNSEAGWLPLHSALGWQEQVIDAAFRLQAGTAYTAAMVWGGYAGAGTFQNFCGGYYHYIMGEFVGEGSL